MNFYTLLVLHKLEHSFGYYDVRTGEQLASIKTREYPHEICLSPNRKKVYIAEMGVRGIESEGAGGHTIAVFDARSRKQTSTIDTGKYDRPHGIATYGPYLYVTSESTKHLLVFDLETESLVRAVFLDQECAHMVSVSPDGSRIYTTNIWSNSITVVDATRFEVVSHITVPERPEGMALSPDGKLMYCVCREARAVAVVDCEKGMVVDQIETGHGPVRVVITPDGKHLAIPVGPHPAGTCMSPEGKLVFMSCEDENLVYVFDMETMDMVQKIKTGDGADAMVCLLASELK